MDQTLATTEATGNITTHIRRFSFESTCGLRAIATTPQPRTATNAVPTDVTSAGLFDVKTSTNAATVTTPAIVAHALDSADRAA